MNVTDTGTGMDEATLKRATEPFFTTKGVGKGTGLGLSMVHGLAAQSGGAMRITSEIGARHHRPALAAGRRPRLARCEHFAAVVGADEAPPPRTAACRVLLVDDDPLIAASAAAMLEDLGHVVVEASSAARALDVLRLGAKIDLVITDQAMPGMTGLELARHMRHHWPDIPLILTSGYIDLPDTDDVPIPRLPKPYQQSDLAACIAAVLGLGKVISAEAVRWA